MSEKTIGQVAFETYNESKGGVTYDGKPIPPWGEVGDSVRAGWEASARAVAEHTLRSLAALDGGEKRPARELLALQVDVTFVETSTFGAGFRAQTTGLDEVRCSTERVERDFGLAQTPGEALRWLADDVDREVAEQGWRRIAVLNEREAVLDEATEERRWDAAHGRGE